MAKKIIILLLLSLIFGQVVRIPLGSVVTITPIDVFALLLIPFWVIKIKKLGKLGWALVFFIITGFLSLLLNGRYLFPEQFLVSFLYLFRWSILAGIYFIVREFDKKTKQNLLFWLALTGVFIAVLGFVQYFIYPDLRNLRYAGWDEHLYRLFSTFLDPNFAGAIFVLVFILLLGLLLSREKKADLFHFTLVLGTVINFIALLLTYSRSAFLMFFVSVTIFMFLIRRRILLLMFFTLFTLGIILLPKNLPSEGVNLTRTASIFARQGSIERAWIIFKDNPILGVGFNAYRYAQMRYGFLDVEGTHSGAGTDNSFLFVLATTGIIGFIAYLYLWFRILKVAFLSKEEMISKVVIASSFGLFINSFFINSLFYESILVWMWVLIGVRERK